MHTLFQMLKFIFEVAAATFALHHDTSPSVQDTVVSGREGPSRDRAARPGHHREGNRICWHWVGGCML